MDSVLSLEVLVRAPEGFSLWYGPHSTMVHLLSSLKGFLMLQKPMNNGVPLNFLFFFFEEFLKISYQISLILENTKIGSLGSFLLYIFI